jgi:peptide/nickel transport system substrate-binding protein
MGQATSSAAPASLHSKAGSAAVATTGHTLVIAIPYDVETLDPDYSHYPLSNEVNYNTNDQYFVYGMAKTASGYTEEETPTIDGQSIVSWKEASNGLSIVLNLRPNMRFCNGAPVTATDYLYYFSSGVQTKSGYLFNIDGAFIKSWKEINPESFELTFSQPSPFFFDLFRDQSEAPINVSLVDQHATKSDPFATAWRAKNDAGSGPYCVTQWIPGTSMTLTANPYYWKAAPYYTTVKLEVVPNSAERALLLKEGSVNFAYDLTYDELNSIRGAAGVKVLNIPSRDQYEVGLNNNMKPFNNVLVRQALSYAVPYKQIISGLFGGRALLPMGMMPDRGLMFDPKSWPYSYDPTKAKALLAKAGYPNGLSFTLDITAGDAISEELAEVLQSSLTSIGVKMTINEETSAVYAQKLDDKTHQAWLEDVLWYVNDPAYVGNSFYRCGALLDWTNYCNTTVDSLISKMVTLWRPSQTPAKQALADQMQVLVNNDAPTLILAEPNLQVAMSSNITGYVNAPDEENLYYYLKG